MANPTPTIGSTLLTSENWAGSLGDAYIRYVDELESQLAPINSPLFSSAKIKPGEHIINVGCGRDSTTGIAADLVGSDGKVTAIDVSGPSVVAGKNMLTEEKGRRVEWVEGDAQTYNFSADAADCVISRFGTMFFADPVVAFRNLAHATKWGGRLVMAVWQPLNCSPIVWRGIDLAVKTASSLGVTLQPELGDVGAWGIKINADRWLGDSGWTNVQFAPQVMGLYLGGAGTSPAKATEMILTIGPLCAMLTGVSHTVVEAVSKAVKSDLEECWDGTGCCLDAAFVIITATRSIA